MSNLFRRLLEQMVQQDASDLFLVAGAPPAIKVHGKLLHLGNEALSVPVIEDIMSVALTDLAAQRYQADREANFAISRPGLPRFRANAYQQRNSPSLVIRQIKSDVPDARELGLPTAVDELAMLNRGLVLVVGSTGSGKSTTLASMVDHRNTFGTGHIITVEDPIEYVHKHRNCMVTQREVGVDTDSFETALQNTLRQAPDCVVIGEIRTREAMEQAVKFAETGHLCLATLHANNANQAMDRILHFFPSDQHDRVRLDLSMNLKGVVAQQLLPRTDAPGLVLASELLVSTPLVSQKIRNNTLFDLKDLMIRSKGQGMQTFDQSLFDLHLAGKIDYQTALSHADSMNDLRLKIKLKRDGRSASGAGLDRIGLSD